MMSSTTQSHRRRPLLPYGARPTDADANGKTIESAAASVWIRELLT
jgi:hypothetical protein